MTLESPMMNTKLTMNIIPSGISSIGTLRGEMGEWKLHKDGIGGNQITFSLTVNMIGQMVEMSCEGTVEEDPMSGTIEAGEMGTMDWRAEKVPLRMAYEWFPQQKSSELL